ncbi:MAG: peptide deformylase [Candidatus Omnitrophica bacterium]|nr:peptide deformylase [Candidatus Omnitrophota bacterium]
MRKPARKVLAVGPAEKMLIKEMIRAMYAFDGSGLAAVQVGIEEKIFVADAGEGPFVVINPEIIKFSLKQTVLEEGCLSFPGIHIKVKRPESVRVRYMTERSETVEIDVSGLAAKIYQHETDHLNGRMIIDHASKAEKDRFKVQLAQLENIALKKIRARA